MNLFGRLAWVHEWQKSNALTAGFSSLPGTSFIVSGAKPAPNLTMVTAGVRYKMHDGWSVSAKFDGEFGSRSANCGGSAQVRYTW